MNPLFALLTGELSALTDEALTEALEAHREVARRIHARDAELLDGREAEDVITQFTAGVAQIRAIETEIEARAAAEAAGADALDQLAADAGVVEPEAAAADVDVEVEVAADAAPVEPAADAEPATDAEPVEPTEPAADAAPVEPAADAAADEPAAAEPAEAVTAAATTPPPARRMRLPRPSPEREPAAAERTGAVLVASAGIDGVREGSQLDRIGLAEALMAKQRRMSSAPEGFREEVVVASVNYEYPEDRVLTGDPEGDSERIRSVADQHIGMGVHPDTGEPALIAAGGLCAPLTPIYDLPVIATAARPVRDALAGFQATRGGITFPSVLTLADVDEAVGIITMAQDEAGGTPGTKTCQVLDCEPFSSAEVDAVFACIQWGNIGARTWPERVAAFTELVMAAHARLAEGNLLDSLSAGSTQVTAAEATYGYGATSNLISQILAAAAGMRSRHRTAPDLRLRAIFPAWVADLLVADLANSQFNRFEKNRAGVLALLNSYGITASFTLDSATGDGQVFGNQGAGALLTFPDIMHWFLFPEGTWLFLDGGSLDLGIVRDSTLNATNDYQVFSETWEQAAMLGVESIEVTSILCSNGATGGPATLIDCTP